MLLKLSLTGIKSRLKDYIVLFSGLTIASAIFYMFLSLATNHKFLESNSLINNIVFVFGFGIVLLSIITFVYIIYANNFLLSMRQRDYGMFMMLGAKSSKIGTLIFVETFLLGIISSAIGILIGIFLTQIVANLLINNLGLTIHGFIGFYFPAAYWTIAFFAVIFLLAALWNQSKLVRTPVLELLNGAKKPVKVRRKSFVMVLEIIAGIILLAIGYWAMASAMTLQLASIPIALFTIVGGTYFVFDSLFVGVINALKKRDSFLYKKINSFTTNQLRFRITEYTRILSVISLLFALALGAITVGIAFKNEGAKSSDSMMYYDAVIANDNATVKKEAAKLEKESDNSYQYKVVGKKVFVNEQDLVKNPLKQRVSITDTSSARGVYKTQTYNDVSKFKEKDTQAGFYLDELFSFIFKDQEEYRKASDSRIVQVVNEAQFNQTSGDVKELRLIRTKDFKKSIKPLIAISNEQEKAFPILKESYSNKMYLYQQMNSVFSGFEFMGFFLGIAFLTMLASTLMFKILSGAQSDVPRYEMLSKMGTRTKLLKGSINKEIGVLFALPAGLGIIHVLFGLQFFKLLLDNPYYGIWIPFSIFLVLYFGYYLITTWLYKGIVLRNNK